MLIFKTYCGLMQTEETNYVHFCAAFYVVAAIFKNRLTEKKEEDLY